MWVQDCSKKCIPVNSNVIQEKAKPSYNNLKQKEGKGSKTGEFNDKEGGFDNFRRRFCSKNKKKVNKQEQLLLQT